MLQLECPLCDGDARMDETVSRLDCDACGVSLEVAPDPLVALDVAA
jgi:hypothetical protein